jgi:hypothetical protein
MNIVLPLGLEHYLTELVKTRGYNGPEAVISGTLHEHQLRHEKLGVVMTPELERLLDKGLENLELSRTTDELRGRS